MGYLSLAGSSILLSMVVQRQVVISVLSQEKMSTWPSTPPSFVQPLWGTVWRLLKKLKIELLYGPAIPLLSIYPEKNII